MKLRDREKEKLSFAGILLRARFYWQANDECIPRMSGSNYSSSSSSSSMVYMRVADAAAKTDQFTGLSVACALSSIICMESRLILHNRGYFQGHFHERLLPTEVAIWLAFWMLACQVSFRRQFFARYLCWNTANFREKDAVSSTDWILYFNRILIYFHVDADALVYGW